ncbi:uncharacterized protein LOC126800047 [Argentina anserina]|uniref:uncharacterized protein LOC126800047 n=1 Tax=Argentina anserina TaxID=57926 RepID=UPI0021767D8F|nr:uncharacterized protein LOC126800047 [Potentilla anserina]
MANQDEGWPLGLRPLNARVGLMRNRELSAGSASFSTLVTGSPTSSASSDLDTESTGSLFHDNGITLGSLIGVSSIFDLSRRSSMGRTVETSKNKKNCKSKHWLFSLCSKLTPEDVHVSNTPSLGHFLEAERRGSTNSNRRIHSPGPIKYGPDDFSPAAAVSEANELFVDGVVAAAQTSSVSENADNGGTRSNNRELIDYGSGFRTPLLVSCLCGQLIK